MQDRKGKCLKYCFSACNLTWSQSVWKKKCNMQNVSQCHRFVSHLSCTVRPVQRRHDSHSRFQHAEGHQRQCDNKGRSTIKSPAVCFHCSNQIILAQDQPVALCNPAHLFCSTHCAFVPQIWDIGGQPRFRSMWERYCRGVNAIVWVQQVARFTIWSSEVSGNLNFK